MSLESCRTTDANSVQIRFHYRATPTIALILANAGIHLSARTEQCVGKSTHSGKHLQTQKQRPPLSSFSRTRESIYSRAPSSALEKVLTAANIPNAESKVNAVVPSTRNARFRMDPRLREDDKQKTKKTSKQENVWEGVEYFCLQKAATRQTRTALKFVSII
ncbi:hypothetical protein M2G46_14665, partial [Vibrio vulnificus]|nr:hypothetical protein [Vibrio vulnificus]